MKVYRPQLATIENCTGCMVCADSCARHAISTVLNAEGHYTYSVNEEKCILCHQCEKNCPAINGKVYGNNDLKASTPFAAWTVDNSLRKNSTSGGVFAGLAKSFLEQGGKVYGAKQDKFYVHHIGISDLNDIPKLQGSKYTQSKTEGIYNQVKTDLNEGKKVLFSGMACQVAALLNYLERNKNIDNLFTVDLICGGVPSSFLIQKYVEKYGHQLDSIYGYRNKTEYVFSVIDNSGTKRVIPLSERPLPLCGFYTNETDRYVCYDCPFAYGHRKSDLTIGDYWGNELYPDEYLKGVSVAIAHTAKGLCALQESHLIIHKIEWKDFLPDNPRMVCGYAYISSKRRKLAKAFKKYSYNRILEDYANKATFLKPWTVFAKVRRFIIAKIVRRKRQNYVSNLLKEYYQ